MKRISTLVMALCAALAACAADLGQGAHYGAYGGPTRTSADAPKPFSLDETPPRVTSRWFPTHVVFSPDESHLLVSLCHTVRTIWCRIAKYHLNERRWEILPAAPNRSYRWPVYAPDGTWIAATSYECDAAYRCNAEVWSLVRLSPDGTHPKVLAITRAEQVDFSPDGRRLIYWKKVGRSTSDVAELDLTTGKERPLTDFRFYAKGGRPLYLPDGQRFTFGADIKGALPGVKFDPRFGHNDLKDTQFDPLGPNSSNYLVVGRLDDAPFDKRNFLKLRHLWEGESAGHAFGITGDGRVIYQGWPTTDGKKAADNAALRSLRARRDANGIDRVYKALFLRKPGAPEDDAFFDLPVIHSVSVTKDGRRIAFAYGDRATGTDPTPWGFGLMDIEKQVPELIDWPRMELRG